MNIEYYANIEDMPAKMREELNAAQTADKAEAVFHAWRDKGYFVEAMERANLWLAA
jgi:hypothetical protein